LDIIDKVKHYIKIKTHNIIAGFGVKNDIMSCTCMYNTNIIYTIL